MRKLGQKTLRRNKNRLLTLWEKDRSPQAEVAEGVTVKSESIEVWQGIPEKIRKTSCSNREKRRHRKRFPEKKKA